MKIISWNVNGIRAVAKKGFKKWLDEEKPDILGLQEIKANEENIPKDLKSPENYNTYFNPAERKGYSGVATFSKEVPTEVTNGIGIEKFDNEGRVTRIQYDDFYLYNIYFPNGGSQNKRVPYKLDFYEELLKICDQLHQDGKNVIITGDFNTAHAEIDLANPKANEKNTGFLPEERKWIDIYLEHGFVDAYRKLYPENEVYTWWTYRFQSRERDVGWRLDYFLVSESLMEKVNDVVIHGEIMGSDHCPVSLILKD